MFLIYVNILYIYIYTSRSHSFYLHNQTLHISPTSPSVSLKFIPPFGNLHRYIQVTVVVPRATVEADVPWSSLTVPTRPQGRRFIRGGFSFW